MQIGTQINVKKIDVSTLIIHLFLHLLNIKHLMRIHAQKMMFVLSPDGKH